ncbi:MAG: hypothetical protein QG588_1957 [Candidatus Poribacteria bacterium]|nr:hypothetical protein [Candidatus Poribacteria bacterium]
MRLVVMLLMLIMSVSAWAGTFKDDFEDGNWNGWQVVAMDSWDTNVGDRISIAEGILSIDSMDKPERLTILAIVGDWKDYSFSADMRIVKAESGGDDAGGIIISRFDDISSYGSYYIMGCTRHGLWGAGSLIKSKSNVNAWVVFLAGVPRIGEWYRLRIDQEGNKISFYINDELKNQSNDSLHPSGGVCLCAYNAIVEFDNVVITGDDIPDVDPSGYAVKPKAKLTATWGRIKE